MKTIGKEILAGILGIGIGQIIVILMCCHWYGLI